MIHLPRSHEGVSGRTDGQGPGVSRARNYLNQTGLEEVNFQWSFNKLKFSHVCVWLSWPVKVWTLCNSTVGSRTALRRSEVGPVIRLLRAAVFLNSLLLPSDGPSPTGC